MSNSQLNNGPGELFIRIAAGDGMAFQQAHSFYKDRLFFYARQFQLEWDEVRDVVADAFLALWRGRNQLKSNEHLKNFLYFAVRNHALKAIEARYRRDQYAATVRENLEPVIEPEIFSQAIAETEMMQLLNEGIMALPSEYRRIFELSYYQEKRPKEIASMLDTNPATIRSQKRRAIDMLRDWIQKRTPQVVISLIVTVPAFTILKKILIFLARRV